MKKNKNFASFSLVGFLVFFLTITAIATISIFVYYLVSRHANGNTTFVALGVLGAILFGAFACTLFDTFRRRRMIDRPTKRILDATEKIAAGDFNIKLEPLHEYTKYDEFDLIFENINIMTAELKKNEVLKNDFISNVSHEIKTPLAVIQNYAKSLQRDRLSSERKEEYLSGLISQTEKLSNLVTNILKLSKLENQEIIPEKVEIDLAELLRVSALQFESIMEKKQLTLLCNIDEMSIISSPTLLELVINNLISNAIKFTDEGGKISISLKEDKKCAVIKVKDSGCGISREVGEHIFEKFYQGDTSHSGEGNGLGLALVKKVIDLIGGEISVESKVGKGSTFTVKLKKETL